MPGFHLTVVTPEGKAYDGTAVSVTAPGELGSFGVLEHHAPMIVGLKPGIMAVSGADGITYFATGEGVFEVSLGSEVVVLVDHAEKAAGKLEAETLVADHKAGT